MEREPFTYHKSTYNAYDAQQIVFEARRYESDNILENANKRATAKSIIGHLSMKYLQGHEYTVCSEEPDAKAAARGVADFIAKL